MIKLNCYFLFFVITYLYFKAAALSANQNVTHIPIGSASHKLGDFIYIKYNPPDEDYIDRVNDLPKGILNFTGLANKYDFKCLEYDVVTEDGYILKLFNIPGNKERPVFLLHGFSGSADDYLLRGRTSLGILLAEAGYDVWAGNIRGNRYSRRHVKLDPNTDNSFWQFSMDEQGLIDLPAMIDFILTNTGQEKLSAVAFSQGTTTFFILGAGKPEYNNKINVFISLASICFIHKIGEPLHTIAKLIKLDKPIEVFRFDSPLKIVMNSICTVNTLLQYLCNVLADLYTAFITGKDDEEIEVDFQSIISEHNPAGSSSIVINHYHQMAVSRRFQRYDFGARENFIRYECTAVPEYNLSKATMNIAIIYGKNDHIGTLAIARTLKQLLPNVVSYKQVEWEKWTHYDFIYGRNADKYVYIHVINILQQI